MALQPVEPEVDSGPVPRVQNLVRFLESIATEIAERDEALDRIELWLAALWRQKQEDSALANQLIVESAVHRRELRHAIAELRRIGCLLLSRRPPTIYIRAKAVGGGGGWIWKKGRDPVP